MAGAWEDMNDIQRASALELMGGKRQANTLSALISNFDTVEEAIEASSKSAGSALKENERYLDSIQGRIDQFNNALQAMWNNVLDDDLVKFIVQAGTELLKVIDSLGVVKTLVIGIGTYLIQKNFKGDLFGGLFNAQTVDEARDRLKNLQVDIANLQKEGKKPKKIERKQNQANTLKASIDKYDELSKQLTKNRIDADAAKKALDDYNESLAKKYSQKKNQGKSPTAVEAAEVERLQKAYDGANDEVIKTEVALKQAEVQAKATGTAGFGAGKKIATGFKTAGKAIWQFGKEMLKSMAYTMAIAAVFEAIGNIGNALAPLFKNMDKSAEALQEKLSELENELSSVESELGNLKSELKDTDERIEELMSQGSLTFVEQEELNKLKSVSAELKAQIELQENLRKSMQQGVNGASVEATNAYLDTSFMSEKSKSERQEKGGETGKGVGQIVGTALGALGFFGGPLLGAALMAVGSTVGSTIGGWIGEATVGAVYDSEQSVGEAMDNMLEERGNLLQKQKDALASGDAEAYNEATEALRTYDSQMAKHISQIQQNYNAMDWETASPEDRKEMMEYADWLDKYNISMGTDGAKSNAIARIFGDEAQGNIAKARDEINRLKKNLTETKKSGKGVDEALAALGGFKLNLSDEEVERLRSMGIYLYEIEDYFKDVVKVESEFVDSGLEDVAKDINKITDGLDSLKTAFDEVIEGGVLTAKTILSLKDALGIGADDTKELTSAWSEYLKVMMSGAASTEEMVAVTEKLTQAWIEDALANNSLTPETKMEYVAQLRSLGVENADEYVDDLLQKNMVEDLEKGADTYRDAVKTAYEEATKDVYGPVESFDTFDDARIEKLAEKYGISGGLYDEIKQDVMERYGVEEEAIDGIIDKLKEKAKWENDLGIIKGREEAYNDWRKLYNETDQDVTSDILNKTGLSSLEEFKELMSLYEKFQSSGGGVSSENFYLNDSGYYRKNADGTLETAAHVFPNISMSDAYQKLLPLYNQLEDLKQQGEEMGYIVGGEIIDPEFERQIKDIQDRIAGIETEIDEELTVDIQLKMKLQNKSELVDDIQNTFDTLVNAQKEYDETGYVSVDTLQTLLQLEPKYLDLLVDESGNLNLTKDALYNVARARITDMGIQSQKNILEQATALASKGSSEALREQIEVMQNANEVGADFVEVEMAKIRAILAEKVAAGDLTQAEADAFVAGTMNQIKAVQVATQSALDNLQNSLSSSGNTATAEVEDAFQKAMDYWENRIGANQSLYEQIQNDIDLLEKKGQIAGESYYEAQIAVEEERLDHLKAQRDEATKYLNQFAPGSEKWWEIANTLNDIEGEIDDVTMSIQDLNDAMDQVHWTIFDEAHERMNDLTTQLSNVREILSADEDSFFTDEGEWAETGIAVVATHIQDIANAKSKLADVNKELGNLSIGDFDSEQEYYDKLTELTDLQHDYTMEISESEQAVVDMYESQIDAVEEYTQTLVDSYNDYIDSVKEALDAERDLYDFKKNVQKQSKDIAAIERRIASLSGSTNASDVAERRKLEAELYESRESLNDTYYDHAKQSQQDALDTEATAYEETLTKMVEGMRASLEEATANMENFLNSVTIAVSMNADTVLAKYQDTELYLNPALTNPWIAAKKAVAGYGGDATKLMDVWAADGYFAEFSSTAGTNLSSPWNMGKTAVQNFATSVGSSMSDAYTQIQSNVQNSITELNKLKAKYKEIQDEALRVPSPVGGGGGGGGGGEITPTGANVVALQKILKQFFGASGLEPSGVYDQYTVIAVREMQKFLQDKVMSKVPVHGKFDAETKKAMENYLNRYNVGSWFRQVGFGIPAPMYAKGTTGTVRDQWAITDEPQFGDELTMYATPEGTLSFMRAGSTVIPADLTRELIDLPKVVDGLINRPKFDSGINMIANAINKPEIVIDMENFLKVDRVDKDTLPQLEAMMDKKIDTFAKQLNYSIKRFAR